MSEIGGSNLNPGNVNGPEGSSKGSWKNSLGKLLPSFKSVKSFSLIKIIKGHFPSRQTKIDAIKKQQGWTDPTIDKFLQDNKSVTNKLLKLVKLSKNKNINKLENNKHVENARAELESSFSDANGDVPQTINKLANQTYTTLASTQAGCMREELGLDKPAIPERGQVAEFLQSAAEIPMVLTKVTTNEYKRDDVIHFLNFIEENNYQSNSPKGFNKVREALLNKMLFSDCSTETLKEGKTFLSYPGVKEDLVKALKEEGPPYKATLEFAGRVIATKTAQNTSVIEKVIGTLFYSKGKNVDSFESYPAIRDLKQQYDTSVTKSTGQINQQANQLLLQHQLASILNVHPNGKNIKNSINTGRNINPISLADTMVDQTKTQLKKLLKTDYYTNDTSALTNFTDFIDAKPYAPEGP